MTKEDQQFVEAVRKWREEGEDAHCLKQQLQNLEDENQSLRDRILVLEGILDVEEGEALVKLLDVGSQEYEDGKHSSVEDVKKRLAAKFDKQQANRDVGGE